MWVVSCPKAYWLLANSSEVGSGGRTSWILCSQVTGVLARRGYNIQSLAVGNSETADLSRITTVIPGSKESSNKVIKQLLKLIHIHSVTDLSDLPFITRELMLIKCRCKPSERKELIDLAEIFHGNVCDVSRTTITLEMTGKESKMRAVQDLISPYGTACFPCVLHQHMFAGMHSMS